MCLRLGIVSEADVAQIRGNGLREIVTLSRLLSGKRLFWLQADIIRLFWAQTLFKTFTQTFQSVKLKLESCLVHLSQVDPAFKADVFWIIGFWKGQTAGRWADVSMLTGQP